MTLGLSQIKTKNHQNCYNMALKLNKENFEICWRIPGGRDCQAVGSGK